ncbi:glycosyltransferase family 4 protein [Marinobacter sp. CHS3-4]|uniref:glycosyltransferase family 4 protein n=1 Tax=Marinobacter sp. CHS3-4 TaxID=3045174 RepID=UPI0024B59404|nr:glycosyltransferase family 4 protein [Marinobacter sp. CHS3-4]MDI9245573.1 glycosyltransferase family 4 protein [Marinobacter sp. CHS3-4]
MKILWLSHLVPYPPKGGVLQRSYYLIKELAHHHTVDLVAFNQAGLIAPFYNHNIEEALEDAKKHLSLFCHHVEFFKIPNETVSSGKLRLALKSLVTPAPYTINWLQSAEFERYLHHLAHTEQYDLVHFDTISLDVFRHCFDGIPCFLDHHNIESHMLLRRAKNERNILKKAYFYQEGLRLMRYEQRVCPLYSGHITCSDIDSARLKALTPNSSIKTIPNGVDTGFFRPQGLEQEKNTLIFVGTMNWYPNIEAVLYLCNEVMPLLRKNRSDITLKIIGANPPDEIKKFNDLTNDIKILGFVDEIRDHIEKATLYVCPIMDGGGTKLKILDALGMGKAIIAHRIASEGIDVEEGENIIFADTPEEYCNAIIEMLNDPAKRKRLGEAARQLAVARYDFESIGQALSNYYLERTGH